jgi:hypothetical protein
MKAFKLGLIALLVSAAFAVAPVRAQEVTPEPTAPPVVTTPAPVSDLTDTLLTDVEKFLGTYAGIVGLAVAFVVGLLKNVSFLDGVDARLINIVVSAVFVVGLLLATNFGYGTQFTAAIDALPKVGTMLLGLLAAFGGSTAVHEAAYAYDVPVFGKKRGASAQAVKPSHAA